MIYTMAHISILPFDGWKGDLPASENRRKERSCDRSKCKSNFLYYFK